MNTNDFVSLDIILADVLQMCGDESTRINPKGWYVSQVQKALEELSIDTFWNERTVDVPLDKVLLQTDIPENMFKIGYNINLVVEFRCNFGGCFGRNKIDFAYDFTQTS